jgi:uncharacterized membrane protein YqaE (UPF0057 family)
MSRKPQTESPSIWRVLAAILLPPLAVLDKGWDKILITTFFWFFMWPVSMGVAFYFLLGGRQYDKWKANQFGPSQYNTKPKREEPRYAETEPRTYIELADGEVLEVVDPDDEDRLNRLSR